jgi:plasmid segregation protein ParM
MTVKIKAAIDAGNAGLKAIFDENERMSIPNVIAVAGRERRITEREKNIFDGIHVEVTSSALSSGKGTFFVGKLAAKQSNSDELKANSKKGENDQTIVMMLTAIAIQAVEKDPNNATIEVDVELATGLPMVEASRKGARKAFKQRLLEGVHAVTFLDTAANFEGKRVSIRFSEVNVFAEGHAAYIRLASERKEVATGTTMIVDIGGLTTDVAIIEKDGQIDNDHSTGTARGASTTLDAIIAQIERDHLIRPFASRLQLVDHLLGEDIDEVGHMGKRYNIRDIIDFHMNALANEEYKLINDTWLNVPSIAQAFVIGGGAAIIEPYLKTINENKEKFPIRFLTPEKAIWLIVESYWDLLKLKPVK